MAYTKTTFIYIFTYSLPFLFVIKETIYNPDMPPFHHRDYLQPPYFVCQCDVSN